jgi:hypothetical protein
MIEAHETQHSVALHAGYVGCLQWRNQRSPDEVKRNPGRSEPRNPAFRCASCGLRWLQLNLVELRKADRLGLVSGNLADWIALDTEGAPRQMAIYPHAFPSACLPNLKQ